VVGGTDIRLGEALSYHVIGERDFVAFVGFEEAFHTKATIVLCGAGSQFKTQPR